MRRFRADDDGNIHFDEEVNMFTLLFSRTAIYIVAAIAMSAAGYFTVEAFKGWAVEGERAALAQANANAMEQAVRRAIETEQALAVQADKDRMDAERNRAELERLRNEVAGKSDSDVVVFGPQWDKWLRGNGDAKSR